MRGWWLVVCAAGCYQAHPAAGAKCSVTDQCPTELACIGGLCLAPGTLPPDAMALAPDAAPDASPLPGDAAIDPTLVAHWDFEDDPSNGAHDVTGRGHDATCVTACPTLADGIHGHGYHFTAANAQALRAPDHPDFRGVFTIAGWMRPASSATSDNLAVLSKPLGTGTGNSWQLEIDTSNRLSFSGGTPHSLEVGPVLVPNVWHHVAGTWDGTTKRVYLDGVKVGEVAATDDFDAHAVYLGGDENNGSPVLFFDGVLDDLRVYARVLSEAEIATLATP